MILIEIRKDQEGNYTGLKSEGHAPDTFGSKGNNILCAAISTLVQTLHLFLKIMSNVSHETSRTGFLNFDVNNTGKDTNLAFELVLTGIHNLSKQYPEEVQVLIRS
ncbi:MAG TPA: ribosomal-processing cysteine protease Prp [Leptospiraceae bacterium]|nr:ribosomal-processing cysteine protease Prp [Leptospiraceae bacterium]HMW07828.1 ribosomal-processing cysteine protease Prp [Leptospiraceae bacterium]HMY33486.1 ribosomal-processing cysteine protease Prp [Leptospiraceae bacterium]HMZ65646.1 ribosomal-processing cysteine protease Prp [Leptospiraceae bacterium]HNA05817.1 ribosomal-processing cysteine protease Prp [Leptospiraceae bacterium]